MEQLRTRSPTEELNLYSRILSCDRFERIAVDILSPVAHEVRASSAVFLQFLLRDGALIVGHGQTFALNPRSVSSYAEHFHQQDPVAHATKALYRDPRAPDVVALTELTDMSKLRRSGYYQEFLGHFGIDDVIGVFLPVRTFNDEVLCIGLHRQSGMERFARHEKQRLKQLRPVLHAALGKMTLQSAIETADSAIQAVATAGQPIGLVVLNERLDLVHSNSKGLRDLGFTDARGSALWLQAIREAGAAAKADEPVALDNVTPGIAAVLHRRVLSDGAVRYILSTSTVDDRMKFDDQCQAHSLSIREMDVARLVGAGLGNDSIGDRLGISVRTVENHLRSIYAKAGVTSRTQLLARLFGQS